MHEAILRQPPPPEFYTTFTFSFRRTFARDHTDQMAPKQTKNGPKPAKTPPTKLVSAPKKTSEKFLGVKLRNLG
jgi:hypothetical protein